MRPFFVVTCPLEAIGREVVAGHQVSNPVRPGVGGTASSPAGRVLVSTDGYDRGPLLAGVGLEIERSELVEAQDDRRITWSWLGRAVSEGVELEDVRTHRTPLTMPKTVRSVMPRLDAMSRSRTSGSWAIQTSARPWLVRNVHLSTRESYQIILEIYCQCTISWSSLKEEDPNVRR